MQALTAPPRDDLTADQVTAILTADVVEIDAGLELLDLQLNVLDDISDQLDAANTSITWTGAGDPTAPDADDDSDAPGYTELSLSVRSELQWGANLVRPYLLLTADGITARFNCGAYAAVDEPTKVLGNVDELGNTYESWTVTGYDPTYLLAKPVGDSYAVSAASGLLGAIAMVFATIGLTGVAIDPTGSALTASADMTWTADDTWLTIVNDLLAAAAYDDLWTDENGTFRSQPWVDPAARTPEFTLDVDDAELTIIGAGRSLAEDMWNAPNVWIFTQEDYTGTPTKGAGQYTVTNQSDGPTSIDARGGGELGTWRKLVTLSAADQTTLQTLGDQQVAADRRDTATMTFQTGCLPICGTNDVMALNDSEAGITKVIGTSWTLRLSGALMDWTVESVT